MELDEMKFMGWDDKSSEFFSSEVEEKDDEITGLNTTIDKMTKTLHFVLDSVSESESVITISIEALKELKEVLGKG